MRQFRFSSSTVDDSEVGSIRRTLRRSVYVMIWHISDMSYTDICPSDLFATGGDRSISAVPVVLISCNNSILPLFGFVLLFRRAEIALYGFGYIPLFAFLSGALNCRVLLLPACLLLASTTLRLYLVLSLCDIYTLRRNTPQRN